MRIAYYCQHVLGIGHFQRSLEICRTLAKNHEVIMITGGAPVETEEKKVAFFQLPALVMDAEFKNLGPSNTGLNLEQTKTLRVEKLGNFLQTFKPRVFLVELYPFGRKAFRFELDPVLQEIRDGKIGDCLSFSGVRDILVERHDREKFEQRAVTTLNRFFDGVFIHGDEKLVSFAETFSRIADIKIPVAYTGYVTPATSGRNPEELRSILKISPEKSLIVASIGGGGVGSELLFAVIQAVRHLDDSSLHLQIFTGPYAGEKEVKKLKAAEREGINVERFSTNFTDWLRAADLSISMAGYNTTMNTLAAGVPALLYPFSQNQEQALRVNRLKNLVPFRILQKADLQQEKLAELIRLQLKQQRFRSPLSLEGAANTAALLQQWASIPGVAK